MVLGGAEQHHLPQLRAQTTMRSHSLALVATVLATVLTVAESFVPAAVSALKLSRSTTASCRSVRGQRLALRMQDGQEESPWQWDAEKGLYFDPGSGVFYNPNTGEYVQPPPKPPAPPPKLSARDQQMQRVLEKQQIQDAEKQRKGALALESNRVAVVLGVLFIGTPVVVLLASFAAGVLPNPFEVCIEGGTNC